MKFNGFLEFIGITYDQYNKLEDIKKKYLITYLYDNNEIAATHDYSRFKRQIDNLIFRKEILITPKMIEINKKISKIVNTPRKTQEEINNDDMIIYEYYYAFEFHNIDDNRFDTDIEVEYEKYVNPDITSKISNLKKNT